MNQKTYKNLVIVGTNQYSNRKRMSVVVKDLSKGDNYFMLYCKGDDESMQNTLKFLPEEKNNFKRLNLKFRGNGLKTMVFARKELTESSTKVYIKNFSLIQSQRKDK